VFEIPDFDGKPEREVMSIMGLPNSLPVFTQDLPYQSDSLPKYLVLAEGLVECVARDDLRIKIIDLGGGSFRLSQPHHQALRSRSFLQYRGASELARSITSSGAGGNI